MAEELDLSGHFSAEYTPPEPVTSEEAARDIDHLGLIGEKALKDKGFFTRLVVEDRTSSGRILNPSNVRVLIVDDDESTALLIQKALHSYGLQTHLAHNRQEIIEALGDRKDITHGLMLGADGYITKPVLPSVLLQAIETLIGG